MNILTKCVHGEESNVERNGGVLTPIYTSTAYNYLDSGPLNYPRYFNTINQQEVANKIKVLEKGDFGLVFSSGLAAITTTLMAILQNGDHAIFQGDIYGGTHYAVSQELKKFGIEISFTDDITVDSFRKLLKKNTKAVYLETPSNPLLKIVNLKEIVAMCKSRDLVSIIDNTFASPINQTPLFWGIDVVTHSGTKYLGGHSDITCGAAVTNKELGDKIYKTAVNLGGSLDPQTCYLLDRSLKTLALRVRQQNSSAQEIAEFLSDSGKVNAVYYPGLKSHPDHDVAGEQMTGFGGMLSFEVKGDADEFVKKLDLIKPAISLGGVETTISSPVKTSHSKLSDQERKKAGIKNSLLRLSAGIEDSTDLISDLKKALK
ncbi:MAG: PLP-dependent aspartate aminotransferase family protein [Fulvivirga sp.]|uniref:trans-sulfuration enzyme family protein n=1 Tax=Fulvivirga sp. TaxID=1931237 RepID=UPI0032EC5ACC